jgi:hypothetical protein
MAAPNRSFLFEASSGMLLTPRFALTQPSQPYWTGRTQATDCSRTFLETGLQEQNPANYRVLCEVSKEPLEKKFFVYRPYYYTTN